MALTILALGTNRPGVWGSPRATLARAVEEIQKLGCQIQAKSALYETKAIGRLRQPRFLNAAILVDAALPPATLLRALKRLERSAGRRPAQGPGARPLDLDVIDSCGRVYGSERARRIPGRVILPHPMISQRLFVLCPLLDICPHWFDPRRKVGARHLALRLRNMPGTIRRMVDPDGNPCQW
jgi:2-amino-4-hydroxy-6-hydroxymethyldihydropteridine diphosphokinase